VRGSWNVESIILKDQVLEVRNVEGQLHVAIDYRATGNRIMGDEKLEKVIEKLATSEKTTPRGADDAAGSGRRGDRIEQETAACKVARL
jgi:LDH2 family malate/lactate/ureidoglycolate dehydrogenase